MVIFLQTSVLIDSCVLKMSNITLPLSACTYCGRVSIMSELVFLKNYVRTVFVFLLLFTM